MIPKIAQLVKEGRIQWQRHALERMLERDIFREEVKQVLINGEMIEEYPDDQPFPSGLFLGFQKKNPLHVVAAVDKNESRCYIITVYRPNLSHFKDDFKTRRE